MGRIFGTDGVRGIVGDDLTVDLVERLGKAVAKAVVDLTRLAPIAHAAIPATEPREPQPPLDAFENYIKGLVAEKPDTRATFLDAAAVRDSRGRTLLTWSTARAEEIPAGLSRFKIPSMGVAR